MDGKSLQLPMDVVAIQECIPHRYPFLFVDKVLELEPLKSIVAIKNVSIADPILQGHFPSFPVFPGVLVVEGLAQTSAILGFYSSETGFKDVLLTEVTHGRFRRKVVPGDTLRFSVTVDKVRPPFFWFTGEATVDGELTAKVSFSALMK